MSDVTGCDLRGPVRTLRTQLAEWDSDAGEWRSLKTRMVATFRPDGQPSEIEHHNPDGSILREVLMYDERGLLTEEEHRTTDVLISRSVHTYDTRGRRVSSVTIDAHGTERETARRGYDADGRMTKDVVLPPEVAGGPIVISMEGLDNDAEPTAEMTFHDANKGPMFRVVFDRDREGRVLSERVELTSAPFGWGIDGDMSDDERAALMALLATEFENQTFSHATYAYDEKGRRIETVRTMGRLAETRVTVRYDDLDNPVNRRTVDLRRDMSNEPGAVNVADASAEVQHTRFEYQYDAHGNWTERIVWHRTEPSTEERRSHMERRTITYHVD